MTTPAHRAVHGSSPALDEALKAPGSPQAVASFLDVVGPDQVLGAVQRCLADGDAARTLRLVRAKLKPGRKLTAEYTVVPASITGAERRLWVTWVAPGATAPGSSEDSEAEARRRGVLAPFRRAWAGSDDGRMSLSVSPVDNAFPQLVRLHDPTHVVDVLGTAGLGEVAADDVTVETVRYRPRQRHVLRIGTGPDGRACFAKVYRDEAGARAVDAAARAATAFAAAGDSDLAAAPVVGTYVAADRVTLWPEVSCMSLTEAVSLDGAAAAGAVRAAGTTLRLLHDAPVGEGLPDCPDAVAHTSETLRTAEILDALVATVGSRLRREVGRGLELLAALPLEPPTTVHGDFKCDNLLVTGSRLHVLDFDRLGRGDPAADIGKFLADLRWAAGGDGHALAALHEVFLEGYGDMSSARAARAHVYDCLSQLRMAARRVPIQDRDWADRVTRAVGVAADTLAAER